MNIRLDPAAQREIQQAALFYEDCRHGLGLDFLEAIESGFYHIQQHPRTWRLLRGRFRRYLLQKFPYGIIYAIERRTIYVAAVMHLKRKPDYWISRAK